jgi:hypothetical protein
MPIAAVALSKVTRSPSLLSEQSSSLSESPRHVSFNQDVSIKRIPKKAVRNTRSVPLSASSSSSSSQHSSSNDEFAGKCQDFVNLPPPSDATEVQAEAEGILKQLQDIECSVSDQLPSTQNRNSRKRVKSPSPKNSRLFASNPNLNRVKSPTLFSSSGGSKYSTLERIPFLGGRLSKSSSDLLAGVERGGGKKGKDRRDGVAPGTANENHTLSASIGRLNTPAGMRVEGSSEQEDCPSPADQRLYGLQALSKLDNAVNGKISNLYKDSSGSTDYSPPPKKNNYTPPKPPRKATSTSPPPNYRKGYSSLDELEIGSKPHSPEKMDYSPPYPVSYTSANPNLQHLRSSPSRYSPARQSPSRGNHTDSELLSSPSQVLYATISADKHAHSKNSLLRNNQLTVHSASQTVHSGFRPLTIDRQTRTRSGSKENILDEPASYRYNNGSPAHHSSRSLERVLDSDKENRRQELKARIHVTSPHRFTPERQVARKPYKTTINTANDTIQYKGFSSENLKKAGGHSKYDKPVFGGGRRLESEHYKVPKNKVPVPAEFATAPPPRSRRHESDTSSSAQNSNYLSDRQFQSALGRVVFSF